MLTKFFNISILTTKIQHTHTHTHTHSHTHTSPNPKQVIKSKAKSRIITPVTAQTVNSKCHEVKNSQLIPSSWHVYFTSLYTTDRSIMFLQRNTKNNIHCVASMVAQKIFTIIIIIMYIYHALINAMNAHMIYINLNMIFCTHVEHSPTKQFT